MPSLRTPRAPGPALSASSAYAERREAEPGWHDRAADALVGGLWRPLADALHLPLAQLRPVLPLAARGEAALREAGDEALRLRAKALQPALRQQGFTLPLVAQSLALWREAATRVLQQRPHEVQLLGALALLRGQLAEMATGEGKTLAASLAAGTAALAGIPVHVITVNDYLAQRDAAALEPLYAFFGLRVGCVVQGMPPEARAEAYRCDITYCSNKELAFDYLKDRVALAGSGGRLHLAVEGLRGRPQGAPRLLLRGLHLAIVDEADSVLIDEARTPLILSAGSEGPHEAQVQRTALLVAGQLEAGRDYRLDEGQRRVELLSEGAARVADWVQERGGVWASARGRHELIEQALAALLLFQRDRQYIVAEGKVQIVDEFSGRVMPDRSWQAGLHQMIEAKEGVDASAQRVTLARITYQRLFRRYLLLAGMTGTAREVAGELWSVYRLRTVRIPTHRPVQRRQLASRLFPDAASKWQAVAQRVQQLAQREGRPVLLGTRSVRASEELSATLAAQGLAHVLLNARQDRAEAEIVAQAGQCGRVTVATNMAGRGTDIHLAPEARAAAACTSSSPSAMPRRGSIASSSGAARARATRAPAK